MEEAHVKHHQHSKSVFESMRNNLWMPAAIVLALVLVGLLVFGLGGTTSGVVTEKVASENLINFAKSQGVEASVIAVVKEGTLYKITSNIQGKEFPLFVTLDGKYLINNPIPMDASAAAVANAGANSADTAAKEVPKTEKPVIDLYVFAYCPYGLQMEKAFFPLYNSLKSKVDFNIVFIGAMHDPQGCSGSACFEKTESYRQLCIQKNYGKDKLWAYLAAFDGDTTIGNCRGDEACLTPLIQKIFTNLSIDKTKVNSCMSADAAALYAADEAKASQNGVSGSPTLSINGVQTQASRSPDGVGKVICSSFTTAPANCGSGLSTSQASPGFGYSTSADASAAASCGAA